MNPNHPVVYSLPDCVQCVAVKRALTKHGITFIERDLQDPDNLEYVKALGYMAAPVTVADWFDPASAAVNAVAN